MTDRSPDEKYDTMMEVERDPTGAFIAIQTLAAEGERLRETLSQVADLLTLSGHHGELDWLIEEARVALGRDPKTNRQHSKGPKS